MPPHNTAVIIRPASTTDAPDVAVLLTELGYRCSEFIAEKQIRAHTGTDGAVIFVAECKGRVVGFASFQQIPLFHTESRLGRITSFIVAASYRKSGIGRSLTHAVEHFAWEHGCERIEVTSGDQRSDAHSFYERLGYKPTSRRFVKSKLHDL